MDFEKLHLLTRSYRRFTGEELKKEDLIFMADAARTGSSAGNRQVLHYYLVLSEEKKRAVMERVRWGMYLAPNEREVKKNEEPSAFIVITKGEAETSANVLIDAGIAACNITHAGMERGIATCILASFKKEEMKEALGINVDEEILLIIAAGRAAHKSYIEKMDGSVKYYLDENRDFHVPKRELSDVLTEI